MSVWTAPIVLIGIDVLSRLSLRPTGGYISSSN